MSSAPRATCFLSLLVPDLIRSSPEGLHCAKGKFHIDPWRPVPLALITHAHSDHARSGHGRYICSRPCVGLLKKRLGANIDVQAVEWGEPLSLGGTTVSFHPAGHVLGSAQVCVEGSAGGGGSERWVFTGDYKRAADRSCESFEVVPCDVLISEATFALPIYRWPAMAGIIDDLLAWWDRNRAAGRASVIFCYALGKAQRLLAEIGSRRRDPIYVHGAVEPLNDVYREQGVGLAPTQRVSDAAVKRRKTAEGEKVDFAGDLILAPTSAYGSPWMRRFGDASTAFASGWMRVRGVRRWRGYDRGFVVSDHADWDELVQTVRETGARRVLLTHGYSDALVRYLREGGLDAATLRTEFEGEGGGEEAGPPAGRAAAEGEASTDEGSGELP